MNENYLNTQSSLAMKSAGYYSAKTVGAKIAIDKTQKVIENALKTIPSTEILNLLILEVQMVAQVKRCGVML